MEWKCNYIYHILKFLTLNVREITDGEMMEEIESEYNLIEATVRKFENLAIELQPLVKHKHEKSVTATLLGKLGNIQQKREQRSLRNLSTPIMVQVKKENQII